MAYVYIPLPNGEGYERRYYTSGEDIGAVCMRNGWLAQSPEGQRVITNSGEVLQEAPKPALELLLTVEVEPEDKPESKPAPKPGK